MLHFKSNNFACASYLTGWFGKGAIALYKMLLSTPWPIECLQLQAGANFKGLTPDAEHRLSAGP